MSTTIFLEAAQHERQKYFNASLQWSKYISLGSEWSTRWSRFEEEVVLWIFMIAKNNIVICRLSFGKTISQRVMMRETVAIRRRPLQLSNDLCQQQYNKEWTSSQRENKFLAQQLKNNNLRQITLQLSFFSHHACEKSNTLLRPLSSPPLFVLWSPLSV